MFKKIIKKIVYTNFIIYFTHKYCYVQSINIATEFNFINVETIIFTKLALAVNLSKK